MKYKKISLVFCISLSLCVLIRTFQQFFQIDRQTGFFLSRCTSSGYIGLGIAAALILTVSATAFSVRRNPVRMPRVNALLCAVSFGCAVTGVFAFSDIKFSANMSFWKSVTAVALLALYVLFMAAYAFKGIKNYRLKRIFYIIPVVYWTVRLIAVFSNVSSAAVIGDNAISILAHCAIVLFSLEFAKTANGFDSALDRKKLLSSGYGAGLLALTSSVPRLLLMFADSTAVMHESTLSTVSVLFAGLFAISFVCAFFSHNNLEHHHKSHTNEPDDGSTPFYFQ